MTCDEIGWKVEKEEGFGQVCRKVVLGEWKIAADARGGKLAKEIEDQSQVIQCVHGDAVTSATASQLLESHIYTTVGPPDKIRNLVSLLRSPDIFWIMLLLDKV